MGRPRNPRIDEALEWREATGASFSKTARKFGLGAAALRSAASKRAAMADVEGVSKQEEGVSKQGGISRRPHPTEGAGQIAPGLSGVQAQACRRKVLDGWTQERIAEEAGVVRTTVAEWQRLRAWDRYTKQLRIEMHEATVEAHKAAAAKGAGLRVQLLGQVEKILALADQQAPEEVMGITALKDLASALDRLTTSAEDRAGYPKTERHEVEGEVGHRHFADIPDEDLDGEVQRLRRELRLIEGEAS